MWGFSDIVDDDFVVEAVDYTEDSILYIDLDWVDYQNILQSVQSNLMQEFEIWQKTNNENMSIEEAKKSFHNFYF